LWNEKKKLWIQNAHTCRLEKFFRVVEGYILTL